MVKYSKYESRGQTKWQYYGHAGVDPKTGDKIKLRRKGFSSKAEAKLHYERALDRVRSQGTEKRIKYADLYALFLDFYHDTGVTESTVIKYRLDSEGHILPYLGKYYVDALTVPDLQKWVAQVRAKRKDFRKIVGHARAVLNFGVQEGYLSENPLAKVIIIPSKERYQERRISASQNVYTPEQLVTFLDFCRDHLEFQKYVYFRLLAFTGLRRGEALALLKSDINQDDRSIVVNKTLAEGPDNATVVAHHTKTGNADHGETKVYLDQHTFELVMELCGKAIVKGSWHQVVDVSLSEYLFASPRNMSHFHRAAPNEWLSKLWRKYEAELTALGLHRISPHGFRHSQATLLYELGIDPKDAQHRLRHKNLKTTMDIYTHISKDRKASIADELDAFSTRGTTLGAKVIQFPTQKERESLI